MKKYIQLAVIAVLSTILVTTEASAQNRRFGAGGKDSASIEQRKAYRQQLQARYDSLSPEQKKMIRQKMRSKLDSVSPEQKKEMRKQFKEKYKGLTPEERQKLREDVLKAADSTGQKPVRRRKLASNQ